MTAEKFINIKSEISKLEKGYISLIAYLVSERNYHVASLNGYSEVPQEDNAFNSHVVSYVVLDRAIKMYEKSFNVIADEHPFECKHPVGKLMQDLSIPT